MKGNSIALFIFEGEKQEKRYMDVFLKALCIDINRIEIAFCTHIYALYQKLEKNDGLDTFELLKECKALSEDSNYDRDDVARIYLFFDYDGHVPEADNAHIKSMLKRFNNETEDGKLFLSYPMLEALADKSSDFQNAVIDVVSGKEYKKYKKIESYSQDSFKKITKQHLKKANDLVNGQYENPDNFIKQYDIFIAQLTKYIIPNNKVAILSALPLFVLDYKGTSYIKGL